MASLRKRRSICGLSIILGVLVVGTMRAQEATSAQEVQAGQQAGSDGWQLPQHFEAHDTVAIPVDSEPDTQQCLTQFAWTSEPFSVAVHSTSQDRLWHVRFPSPHPCGVERVDEVVCEWYPVLSDTGSGQPIRRPAVIVIHESGSKMVVGRLIASQLRQSGIHAFLVQLPGYGERRSPDFQPNDLVAVFTQGVTDVRRARDAVAALPFVDDRHIGLQGTSLGGFVATLVASLDDGFDSVFLLLCGVDLHGVLTSGTKDAERTLRKLREAGLEGEQLKSALQRVEPGRVAQRIQPSKTWLYSGAFDQVVRPEFSSRLAERIDLDPSHHIRMLANHYSGVIYLPSIIAHIRETVEDSGKTTETSVANEE